MHKYKTSGFTLIELSLVLVIIGLIIGGILFGRDMVKAAQLRSLISQMDQFKIATTSFKNKYGSLPGDMHITQAAKFGMFTFTGPGAGNASYYYGYGNNDGLVYGEAEVFCSAECGAFWRHLSDAGLLAGKYGQTLEADGNATHPYYVGTPTGETISTPLTFSLYMPAAKGGFGFVGAGSLLGHSAMFDIPGINQRQNLFWVVPAAKAARYSIAEPSLSAIDSYNIDSKIDDGKPNSGKFIVSVYRTFGDSDFYYWSDGTWDYDGIALNANSTACTIGGADALQIDVRYNTNPSTGGSNVTCIPMFLW